MPPAYEYACQCGKHETIMRSMDFRDLPVRCAACGGLMQRQLAAPASSVKNGTPKFHRRQP